MRILFTLLILALSTACSETPDPDLDSPMAAAGDNDEGLYGADDEEGDQ